MNDVVTADLAELVEQTAAAVDLLQSTIRTLRALAARAGAQSDPVNGVADFMDKVVGLTLNGSDPQVVEAALSLCASAEIVIAAAPATGAEVSKALELLNFSIAKIGPETN